MQTDNLSMPGVPSWDCIISNCNGLYTVIVLSGWRDFAERFFLKRPDRQTDGDGENCASVSQSVGVRSESLFRPLFVVGRINGAEKHSTFCHFSRHLSCLIGHSGGAHPREAKTRRLLLLLTTIHGQCMVSEEITHTNRGSRGNCRG